MHPLVLLHSSGIAGLVYFVLHSVYSVYLNGTKYAYFMHGSLCRSTGFKHGKALTLPEMAQQCISRPCNSRLRIKLLFV